MDALRVLPDRPSLRYLKVEAKRRVSAGEVSTLHEAQLAIAQEHGLPTWAALKRLIADQHGECHPLSHLRWIISKCADADAPGWSAPQESEFREHFAEKFLEVFPPEHLATLAAGHAADLRGPFTLISAAPLRAVVDVGTDIRIIVHSEADPPYRLRGLEWLPLGSRVTDPRLATPTTRAVGTVPKHAPLLLDRAFTRIGVPGLVTAGDLGQPGTSWAMALGWADLETGDALSLDHRFPANEITTLVTAVAVLRLVADGRVGLDDAVNRHLRSIRLADGGVSLRELLTHTAGVATPDRLFAASAPRLEELCGPVLASQGGRGSFRFSYGGYATLGQLLADMSGYPYEEAARRLVLQPLGMHSSWFPTTAEELAGGRDGNPSWAVTCYSARADTPFTPEPPRVSALPAASGLWATPADLVRFAEGWRALLPHDLVHEALQPQVSRAPDIGSAGLGWLISHQGDFAGCVGGGPGSAASLLVRLSDHAVQVTMVNRRVPVEPIGLELLRSGTNWKRR